MVRSSGLNDGAFACRSEDVRWLRSPDHQQVMRVVFPQDEEGMTQAMVEVRTVMGGLPMIRRMTAQAALSTWKSCRQSGWTRCYAQW